MVVLGVGERIMVGLGISRRCWVCDDERANCGKDGAIDTHETDVAGQDRERGRYVCEVAPSAATAAADKGRGS